MPRFSVIIPVYNVAPYLAQCIDSVLEQSGADFEVVCIDDGSTDASATMLDAYAAADSRVRVLHQPNRGLSAARNRGLSVAVGEYVLFVDADDYLHPNALQTIAQHLHGQDMVCFGGWCGDVPEVPANHHYATGWQYYCQQALLPHSFAFVCVVLRCYRRQFLVQNNLWFMEGIVHEDNHFTPRACLCATAVDTIDAALYHYRLRQGSIASAPTLRHRQDMLRVANSLAALFVARPDIDRSVVYRAITHHYQVPFVQSSRADDRTLLALVDWPLYRTVSRTRLRHRINYALLHLSPTLFRWANRFAK